MSKFTAPLGSKQPTSAEDFHAVQYHPVQWYMTNKKTMDDVMWSKITYSGCALNTQLDGTQDERWRRPHTSLNWSESEKSWQRLNDGELNLIINFEKIDVVTIFTCASTESNAKKTKGGSAARRGNPDQRDGAQLIHQKDTFPSSELEFTLQTKEFVNTQEESAREPQVQPSIVLNPATKLSNNEPSVPELAGKASTFQPLRSTSVDDSRM